MLGRYPLPIEVIPFGYAATRRAVVRATGAAADVHKLRQDKSGHPFVTDGGHWIIDAALGHIPDPKLLADRLSSVPGVVEHGLFIGMAAIAILAGPGDIRVVERG
jgi:ribose 5-phosphate isomerase A